MRQDVAFLQVCLYVVKEPATSGNAGIYTIRTRVFSCVPPVTHQVVVIVVVSSSNSGGSGHGS